MNKPTKPTNLIPRSFGGIKNNFSTTLQENGYEPDIPAIYSGGNLNYQLNATGKELDYCEAICDFIVNMPIGKTITVDSNNKLVYGDVSVDVSGKANVSLDNLNSAGQAILDAKELKSNKITLLSVQNTDTQYPSAKCVYNALLNKQDKLISGTNIKTINNTSLLGSGDISIDVTNRANINLSNLTIAGTRYIINSIMPDYNSGISVPLSTTNVTRTITETMCVEYKGEWNNGGGRFWINDVLNWGMGYQFVIGIVYQKYLEPGTYNFRVSVANSSNQSITLYPLKGV